MRPYFQKGEQEEEKERRGEKERRRDEEEIWKGISMHNLGWGRIKNENAEYSEWKNKTCRIQLAYPLEGDLQP